MLRRRKSVLTITRSADRLGILSNKDVLAINQDALGKPGYRIWKKIAGDGNVQLWRGDLHGG